MVCSGILLLVRTQRRQWRAEAALAVARDEARDASRLKSEFLSRISHELRTPLNAILGFSELLQLDDLTTEQSESVDHMLRGGRHLLGLINEVLDISRIETGNLALSVEVVDLLEVVTETADLIRPLAAEREITLDILPSGEGRWIVQADRQRLKQVLLNLASNAVKYNRHAGTIHIACRRTPGDRVGVDVADTGPGIPPDKMERLFMPFDRLGAEQSEVQGTGLGLALSQGLMEAMGGTLTAHSTEGEGTTFTLELAVAGEPVDADDDAPPELAGQPPDAVAGPRHTILYVEDNPSNLRLVERVLARQGGMDLLTASEGEIVPELVRQRRPDLVLLDLHLPGIDGEEVLRRLRADPGTADLPVVIVSAEVNPWYRERLLAAGASDYLSKPLDIPQFLRVLHEPWSLPTTRQRRIRTTLDPPGIQAHKGWGLLPRPLGGLMSSAAGSGEWSAEERELRRVEVASQQRASRWQSFGAIVAAVATAAAAFAALQAAEAVEVARSATNRQIDEDRLSAALDALGGEQPAQRIAGITLLRRNVTERLDRAGSQGAEEADRRDAHGLFATSLLIVQNYLRSAEVSSTRPGTAAGAGYGFPKLASDTAYASRELQLLLNLEDQVKGLPGRRLGVDLSNVVLYGQSWEGVNFSWLNHYSRGMDLRGANLRRARWGTSYLGYSHLQCADLSGSVFGLGKPGGGFHFASLVFADLRGANLSGAKLQADMTEAKLDGANLDGADFTGANLNGVDFSQARHLDRAIGLDRARFYKPPSPKDAAAGPGRSRTGPAWSEASGGTCPRCRRPPRRAGSPAPGRAEARPSAHRFLHELADPLLVGGGQLRQGEGGRPHGALVEVRGSVEPEGRIPLLELRSGCEEADDLAVLCIRGHPVPGSRREVGRAGLDDRMEPLAHGAIRLRHLGELREHVALPVPLAGLQLLAALLHRGPFLVREALGRLAGRGGALGGLRRVAHCRSSLRVLMGRPSC